MRSIEFMGLPGAGKSTLRKRFLKLLKQGDQKCYSSEEALLAALKRASLKYPSDDIITRYIFRIFPTSLLIHFFMPIFNRSTFKFLAQNRFLILNQKIIQRLFVSPVFGAMPFEEKTRMLTWILQFSSTYQLIHEENSDNSVIIFDAGSIQYVISLFASSSLQEKSLDVSEVFQFLEMFPIPEALIFVEAEVATCLDRLNIRGFPERLAHKTSSERSAFLSLYQDLFSHTVTWMNAAGNTVICIDNNDSLENAYQQLVSTLQQITLFEKHS